MSQQSTIEWTDATWNPVRGCTKISPGCKHCYAETFAERFRGVPGHPYEQGFDLRLAPNKLLEPLDLRKPSMIFVNSMSDLFQEDVPESYVELAFEVMLAADWHIYQVLTKRAERMAALSRRFPFDLRKAPHIWLGVSVEDRKYGVPRIEHLRRTHAGTRFLSVEPLLEDVGRVDLSDIDWVIVGGESGHGARPMHPDWVRSLQSQCQETRVAFFFKQWGGVRKKKAGRILDDRTWDEFPARGREGKTAPDRPELLRRRTQLAQKVAELTATLSPALLFRASGALHETVQPTPIMAPSTDHKRPSMPITSSARDRILQLLADGVPKADIADQLSFSKAQVAAVAAHVTMGTYKLPEPTERLKPKAAPTTAQMPFTRRSISRALVERAVDQHATAGRVIEPEPLPHPPSVQQSIFLGRSEDGKPVFWSQFPNESTPNPHVLILGGTGSGKTYATVCLLAELALRDIPSFVFDYGQGFTPTSLPTAFTQHIPTIEYDIARSGVDLNPLRVTADDIHGPVNVAQRFADAMQRVYKGIGIQQHSALRDAVLDTFAGVGILANDRLTWTRSAPSLQELQHSLQKVSQDTENSNRRYAASVAAHIASLFVFNIFRRDGLPLDWEPEGQASQGRVSILQLRGLESSLERAATELMLWDLWDHVTRRGPAKTTRMFVVLDEAHNLPMQTGSPVEKILREGRKFGLGVIIASQQPEDFPVVALSNTATKLLFRLSHDTIAIVKKLMPQAQKREVQRLAEALQTLERGKALVIGHASPVRTSIGSLESRLRTPKS